MNTFLFGSSREPLYGVYHPPRGTPRGCAVVLCSPMGQEYMRAHRAMRNLAGLLARKRFPVLRFDYFGTGDSAGACEEGSLQRWTEDIGTAVEELREMSDAPRISLIGLRVGASLAARHCSARDGIESVVMWDPIVDGSEYIEAMLRSNAARRGYDLESARARLDGPESIPVLGFPLTAEMRRGLRDLDLTRLAALRVRSAYILASSESDRYEAASEHFASHGVRTRYRCIPSPGNWGFVDNNGSALLPQAMLQGIVETLDREDDEDDEDDEETK